jgi:SAM-dependent methyltransferase
MTDADRAHDRLQAQLWGFAAHRVITVAGRTGILRWLARGEPATIESIAGECGLAPLPTGKVVRALTALGLAAADGDRYAMPEALATFFQPGATDLSFFLEHSHDMYDGWGENLEPWLRGEEWSTRPRSDEGAARFASAMQAMGAHVAERLAAMCDLSGRHWVLDVGGGVGHFAEAFCEVNPELEAVVLDTERIAALGRARVKGTPMENRIHFVGGDYLETQAGMDFDFVLLANILHQEPEANAAALVARGAACLKTGGALAVLDFSIDESKQKSVVGTLFAINMRSFGDTHNEPAIQKWMDDAGLVQFQRIDVGPHRWLLSAVKP